jgi:hypothetical protein
MLLLRLIMVYCSFFLSLLQCKFIYWMMFVITILLWFSVYG